MCLVKKQLLTDQGWHFIELVSSDGVPIGEALWQPWQYYISILIVYLNCEIFFLIFLYFR